MKPLFSFLLIATLILSCKSQPKFDLYDIELGLTKVNSIVPEDAKQKTFKLGKNTGLEYTMVRSEELLNFNGMPLSGILNPDSGRGENGVSFYYNIKDSLISKYNITIFTQKEGKNLLLSLRERLGEPNYYSYMRAADKEKDNFNALIWEDNKNNRLYRLTYGLDETVKATLEVTENDLPIEILNLTGPFGYWESYLEERENRDKPGTYTYQQFVTEQNKIDPNNFYNVLTK